MTASVIPYYDELETFGIILHKESEDKIPMKKFDWPKKLGHRQPSGGSDDAICYETISIAWRHNELWVKTPLESTLEAKSLSEKEFSFYGYFYAQLDGDVAYVPKSDEYDFLIIFCEKQKHDNQRIFHAIKFPRGSTIQIDAFVIHTIPIPIMDDGKEEVFNVDMYHRAVNAKSKFISPQNIHIHLLNIDQKTFIPLLDESFIDKSSEPRLSEHFIHKTLNLEEVNQDNFKLYGSLMPNSAHHIEKVNPAHWPYLKKFEKYSKIGPLEQDFRLSWSSHGHDDIQQLIFHGLSGTYEGKEGKPGIEYNPAIKEYVVNVLSTRPDGSYYLHAKHLETRFAMIFALPDENNGDPIETTLKVFLFQNGQALSIHSNIWHSLPILIHPHTAEFHEVVCETNASIDINLPYECGSGLKFKYGL